MVGSTGIFDARCEKYGTVRTIHLGELTIRIERRKVMQSMVLYEVLILTRRFS